MNNPLLHADIDHVTGLAFKRVNLLKNCLTRIHALRSDPQYAAHYEVLDTLRQWLRSAYSLHSTDFKGLADHICEEIKSGRPLHPAILAALKLYSEVPPADVQTSVAACEKNQETGNYDDFLTDSGKEKARAAEERLAADPEARADWEGFASRHPEVASKKGVVTRTLMLERNRKPATFKFENTPAGLAKLELDALAAKWTLWGIEKGKMLLHKLTVTVTPWGIDIFVPRFWSLDWRRDLNWNAILDFLHRWGNERQGAKRHLSQVEANARNKQMYLLHEQGKADGRRGKELKRYVMKEAGVHAMDDGTYRRCVRLGKKLDEAEKKNK